MTLRDLGYRAYDGPRLPPSSSTWVMYRYGLKRATSSVLFVVLSVVAVVPAVGLAILAAVTQILMGNRGFEVARYVSIELGVQTWFFVGLASLLIGATAITDDLQTRAFPFFFAKPLTPAQYLLGRTLAIATLLFGLVLVPTALVILVFAGAASAELRAESLGYLLPVLVQSALVAGVCASTSVALSSLTKNRAITMSTWVVAWLVPVVISAIAKQDASDAWIDLASIPGLLQTLADALLRRSEPDALDPWLATLGLAVYVGGSLALALNRLQKAEVVS